MILKAEKTDYKRLLEIWESAVCATHDFLTKEDFNYYKTIIPQYFSQVEVYIFKDNETVKGFIGVSTDEIEMLFVHDNYRGQGIGKILLNYATSELRKTKIDVNEQNIQALGFYEYCGFKCVSRSDTDSQGKPYPILHMSI